MKSCSKLAFHKPFPDGANYVLSVPLISVWTVWIPRPVDVPITAFLRSKFSCGFPETVLFGGPVLILNTQTRVHILSSHVSLSTSYPNSAGSVEALNLPAVFPLFFRGLHLPHPSSTPVGAAAARPQHGWHLCLRVGHASQWTEHARNAKGPHSFHPSLFHQPVRTGS